MHIMWWILIGLVGFVVFGPLGGVVIVGGEISLWVILRIVASWEAARAMQVGIAVALAEAQIAKLQAETAALEREADEQKRLAEEARKRDWEARYPGKLYHQTIAGRTLV